MARNKNIVDKLTLINESNFYYDEILKMIKQISRADRERLVNVDSRDKSIRDVLAHLHEWHAMLERWYLEGMSGDQPLMPAPGYSWRELDSLNQHILKCYQRVDSLTVEKKFKASHTRLIELAEHHSGEELLTKRYYKWTNSSTLLTLFTANLAEHYMWALPILEEIVEEINKLAKN